MNYFKKILFFISFLPTLVFGQSILYSTYNEGEIIQANLDGSNSTVLYSKASTHIYSLYMDNINNKLYWNERENSLSGVSKLMRSDINSFNEELVLNVPFNEIEDIHVLRDTNLIFFRSGRYIYNNANGSVNYIAECQGNAGGYKMCVDEINGYIYKFGSYYQTPMLYRCNLDGSNQVQLANGYSGLEPQACFFDYVNNRIYFITGSYIYYYDVATDSYNSINIPNNGYQSSNANQLTAYDLTSSNPRIMWSSETAGAVYSVNFDGTSYMINITDPNTYGLSLIDSTSQTGIFHELFSPELSSKRILYSTYNEGEIIQANLDGSNSTVLYSKASTHIYSLYMDNINNKLYWNERENSLSGVSKLMRSDINSFNEELVLNVPFNEIEDIHVLRDTNLIFFRSGRYIYNNANGSVNYIAECQGNAGGYKMCVDEINGYIYKFGSYYQTPMLYRCNLDGSNQVQLANGYSGLEPQACFFDYVNNRIYFITGSYIYYYDVATDSYNSINIPNNGYQSSNANQLTAYDLTSSNPRIMWSSETAGAVYSVNFDGTSYMINITDPNTYGVNLMKKTGTIEGSVFLDLNSDGIYDSTDVPLRNQILELENISGQTTYLTTRSSGHYKFEVDTTQYTLRFFTDTLWTETSNRYSYNINVGPDTTISNLNFGIAPQITKGDMFVDITNSQTVCNMPTSIWLNVKNIGSMTINNVNLDLWLDDSYNTVIDAAGGTINGNHISWNFPIDFNPYLFTGQDTLIEVTVQVPPGQNPVPTLIDSVRVSPVQGNLLERSFTNNFDSISNVLLCSYDPNDKQVFPQKCFYDELDTLDYTIRFQNTGNYPATTVRLVDSLDFEKLDIMSFEFIGASHDHTWSLISPSVLEVVFNNIMLVDSSVSFDDSQGFFKYRIVVRDSLPDMQATSSAAYIYFDLNEPIVTNLPVVNFIDDGNCIYGGCMDTLAQNYDPLAIVNDGSCLYCDLTNSMTVTQNTAGNCDGLIIANSNSSYSPISYSWNTGSSQNIIYGLCSGIYTVTISDTLGCSLTETVYIGISGGCTDSSACNFDSTALFDDGSCLNIFGCTDSTSFNYDPLANCDDGSCIPTVYGCTDPNAINFYPGANVDNGTCIYSGCTDPLALNYNPNATVDDGSCTYSLNCSSPKPDGLYSFDIIDTRAKIGWNNMNDSACMIWKYYVRYRELGTQSWTTKSAGVGNGLCNFGLNTTTKQLLNLNPSTTYEFKMKAFYCGGTESNYSAPVQFTTADVCPEMINLTATTFNNNQTKVRFDWDTTGTYTFARILLRVDTAGSAWQTAGGFGVYYPTMFVNKFGLQSGETYRAQGRTFCDSNITAYRSPNWTNPIYWTQPGSIKLSGGTSINNLDVYPNPSLNIFNISFVSDIEQTVRIKIFNLMGSEIYKEEKENFIGEYIKQINLEKYNKGVYLLEIYTQNGIVNKKLILQ